jgi:hypothetical protein
MFLCTSDDKAVHWNQFGTLGHHAQANIVKYVFVKAFDEYVIANLSLALFILLYFIQFYDYNYFHQKKKRDNKRNVRHNR